MKIKGFTLIELLVVTSIISLLSSIVLASISEAKDKAEVAKAQVETQQVSTAIAMYQVDHNGKVPTFTNNNGDRVNESDEGYTEALQQLVDSGYLTEIPTSKTGDVYSYAVDIDATTAEFKADITKIRRGGGGSGDDNEPQGPAYYTLSIGTLRMGGGTDYGYIETSSPSIKLGYATQFPAGSTIHIQGVGGVDMIFHDWINSTGCNSVSGDMCTIIMDNDKFIAGRFYALYTITTSTSGTGNGTITGNNSPYVYNTAATLTATPNPGSHFIKWTSGCTNSTNPVCTKSIWGAYTFNAEFSQDE